jgi:hypothetical protein
MQQSPTLAVTDFFINCGNRRGLGLNEVPHLHVTFLL